MGRGDVGAGALGPTALDVVENRDVRAQPEAPIVESWHRMHHQHADPGAFERGQHRPQAHRPRLCGGRLLGAAQRRIDRDVDVLGEVPVGRRCEDDHVRSEPDGLGDQMCDLGLAPPAVVGARRDPSVDEGTAVQRRNSEVEAVRRGGRRNCLGEVSCVGIAEQGDGGSHETAGAHDRPCGCPCGIGRFRRPPALIENQRVGNVVATLRGVRVQLLLGDGIGDDSRTPRSIGRHQDDRREHQRHGDTQPGHCCRPPHPERTGALEPVLEMREAEHRRKECDDSRCDEHDGVVAHGDTSEDDERPVPQVPAVRTIAQPHDGRVFQSSEPSTTTHASGDHRRSAADREQRR